MTLNNTNRRQDDTLTEAEDFDITGIEVAKLDDVTWLVSDLVAIATDLDDQLTEALEDNAKLEKELEDLKEDQT